MKTIPLSSATPAQIKTFAQMVGVEIEPTDNDGAIFAKLKTVWAGESISVAEDATVEPSASDAPRIAPEDRQPGEQSAFSRTVQAERMQGSYGRDDPRVVLQLQSVRVGNEVSKTDVPVGVNVVGFQLKTNVHVDVPYRVYEALNNAQREEVTHDDSGEVVITTVHSYPFNVIEMPSRAEVAAWRERTDKLEMA